MSMRDEGQRRTAFEAFYRRNYRAVHAYARRRASETDACEVAAEVFLSAWRGFDDASAGGLPWLYRCAYLTLCNQQRTDRRRWNLWSKLATQRDQSVPDSQEAVADRAAVREAMSRLSTADQELLFLIYWEGVDTKVAAKIVGCSAATAAVRLHRARKRLGSAFESANRPDVKHADNATSEALK